MILNTFKAEIFYKEKTRHIFCNSCRKNFKDFELVGKYTA